MISSFAERSGGRLIPFVRLDLDVVRREAVVDVHVELGRHVRRLRPRAPSLLTPALPSLDGGAFGVLRQGLLRGVTAS